MWYLQFNIYSSCGWSKSNAMLTPFVRRAVPVKLYIKHGDGSLEDSDGNIIFYSVERFEEEICEGGHCFLCGAHPDEKEFSDEHIIPKWVLNKLDLFDESITLPNNEKLRYSKYTVPCCKDCNSFLGREIEEEIRNVVVGGLDSVNKYVTDHGPWKIFLWLALIFFKTHLKDTYLRKHLDQRKGEETIASDYNWGVLHHIHCIVRAIQTGAHIENECFGTTAILPAKVSDLYSRYDYRDTYGANTILLRIGDIAFLSVLDDSCAAAHFFSGHFKRITGPLSPIQLREVLSHLTLLNLKLKYRPEYQTKLDPQTGEVSIIATLPDKMELEEHTKEELGEILYSNVSEYAKSMKSPDEEFNESNIRNGNYHFLFDEKGEFVANSMELAKE
jgi:hypothetical protein